MNYNIEIFSLMKPARKNLSHLTIQKYTQTPRLNNLPK